MEAESENAPAANEAPPAPHGDMDKVRAFSNELLHLYYDRLFPFDGMFRWLSYGNDPEDPSRHVDKMFFKRRELSFTLADDVYIRYRCFSNAAEFREAVLKRDPHKMDIGAEFNTYPELHHSVTLKPVTRELVFDIDMTDYDEVRNCCDGAAICKACWPLMSAAIAVVDRALREDFGFRHLLWVYSGRRGVHCWVCDERARVLTNEQRAQIVSYLHVDVGDASASAHEFAPPLKPCLQRAYDVLEPYFRSIACNPDRQDLFNADHEERWEGVLRWVPQDDVRERVRALWRKHPDESGERKWTRMLDTLKRAAAATKSSAERERLQAVPHQVVFHYLYAKLDVNVSKSMNHLLKSPWVAHPKTGRVCVPIDAQRHDQFDPFAVPTLGRLQQELNAAGAEAAAGPRAVQATSLAPYMAVFDRFLRALYDDIRAERRAAEEESLDF